MYATASDKIAEALKTKTEIVPDKVGKYFFPINEMNRNERSGRSGINKSVDAFNIFLSV
ncbi:hypothetical protein LBMAG27_03720 [Bacteroidota bacterium]|nr:hypothetical protein LBMAG27_03720 [Bacteroidota bacterium]